MSASMKLIAAPAIGGGTVPETVESARAEACGARNRRRLGACGLACVAWFLLTGSAAAQDYAIFWFTIDGGGGAGTGDVYELSGTIGQADAGPAIAMTGGDFELSGGFWSGAVSPPDEGCTGDEKVKKARCRDRNGENQLKVSLVGGRPGDTFTVTLSSDGDTKDGAINARGKGKTKFNNRPPGDAGTATAEWGCGAVEEKAYACP